MSTERDQIADALLVVHDACTRWSLEWGDDKVTDKLTEAMKLIQQALDMADEREGA